MNAQGVQELTLVVTPGGYTPLRFAVKKGVPVKLTFRQLGQVGCGNDLPIFPADRPSPSSLTLASRAGQTGPNSHLSKRVIPVLLLAPDVSRCDTVRDERSVTHAALSSSASGRYCWQVVPQGQPLDKSR